MAIRMNALRVGMMGILASFTDAQSTALQSACDGTRDVTSESTLEALRTCGSVTGNVRIHGAAQSLNSTSPGTIDLGSLNQISGSLELYEISGEASTGVILNAPDLETVGTLNFTGLQQFSMPTFSRLSGAGTISFTDVTFTQPSDFGRTTFVALREVDSLMFSNTSIATIGDRWTTTLEKVFEGSQLSLTIVDNEDLTSINIPGWSGAAVDIQIEGNTKSPVVSLPDIKASALRVRNISAFTAGSLTTIGGSGTAASNDSGSVSDTKPSNRRRQANSDLSYIADSDLTELRLPALQQIDGFLQVFGNDELRTIELPQLNAITGSVDIRGDSLEELDVPALRAEGLSGQLTVTSPDSTACSNIPIDSSNFQCSASDLGTSPAEQGGDGNGDGDGQGADQDGSEDDADDGAESQSGGGGLSTGAKAGIGVGVCLGVLLIALIAFFLYRRRSRSSRALGSGAYDKDVAPSEAATSPTGYSKVPSDMRTEEVGRPVSGRFSYDNANHTPGADAGVGRVSDDRGRHRNHASDAVELEEQQGERFEMEEQQGMRHEMDARSLPDIDLDDESPERRSLEDIERSRNSGPHVGVGPQTGPVSPVG